MKILIFTEGTILMHNNGKDISREERVEQVINNEPSVDDFSTYIPIAQAVEKIKKWKDQGATIYYLTSRRVKSEFNAIKIILNKYHFPNSDNLLHRKYSEEYMDIVEKLMPDIFIEDDCESIGGASEIIVTQLNENIKSKLKSILIKEFIGIDQLPDNIEKLLQ